MSIPQQQLQLGIGEVDACQRQGSVLDSTTILKVDDYIPRRHSTSMRGNGNSSKAVTWFPRRISGAERLRLVEGALIAGVSQPTVPGVRSILDFLGTGRAPNPALAPASKRSVLWINLREEPLLYLNGKAVVLRERNEPLRNMATFKGISEKRLIDLEWRLKEDVIDEAKRCGGSVVVHAEFEEELVEMWESAPPNAVMTAEEVFFQFRQDGYRVKYVRLPCTSNQPPTFHFFDELVQAMQRVDRDTWIVFNCQSGMVRSTLAMVAASAIQVYRGIPVQFDLPITASPSTACLAAMDSTTTSELDKREDEVECQLLAGWYGPVVHMVRLLIDGGREAKSQTDRALDLFSHTNNLRREIFALRTRATNTRSQSMARLALLNASVALQRYMLLILFQAYLNQVAAAPPLTSGGSGEVAKFQRWMDERKEIKLLLKSVASDALAAFEAPALLPATSEDAEQMHIRSILHARKGAMLNMDMIVKWDNAAAASATHNFRKVPGMRIFAMSTCTVPDLRHIIKLVRQSDDAIQTVLFCNLREEPFVYINNKPFVLRSVLKPFRNLDAFQDIDASRLESAEENMKREILQEAARNSGRVLVHNEDVAGSLNVVFEETEEEDCVQTPREVFERFAAQEGLNVKYKRVPITPQTEFSLADIDELIQLVKRYKQQSSTTAFVFFCQKGRGRSTVATIIASLEFDSVLSPGDGPDGDELVSESLKTIRAKRMPKMMSFLSEAVERTSTSTPPPPSLAVVMEEVAANAVAAASATPSPSMTPLGGGGNGVESAGRIASSIALASLAAATSSSAAAATTLPGPISLQRATSSNSSSYAATMPFNTDFPSLLSLCRVLPKGMIAKHWLDHTIDACGQVYNLRRSILDRRSAAAHADTSERSNALIEHALLELRMYFVLLEVAAYCLERKQRPQDGGLFKDWCLKRPELATLKEDIRDASALELLPEVVEANGAQSALTRFVQERHGRVMVRGSILKTDHFPGCRRLPNALVDIEGAPNFRSVWPEGEVDGIDLRAYGTGIPTQQGLIDVLELLQKADGGNGNTAVTWVNLREEPILYCNGRPFVLRSLDEPFANLEHTGISRKRVEEMEARMKLDIEEEARASETHSILIHEEDETGEVVPHWEVLHSIQTPMELFAECATKYNVQYWRVPITDEQSPKPAAFDTILSIVNEAAPRAHLVFNCQMGRGRTTTGLVVACAARLRKLGVIHRFVRVVNERIAPKRKFRSRIRMQQEGASAAAGVMAELKGDFLAITAQVRLLDEGMEAKRVMDALIDVCDAMQNLREAVYDVKLRSKQDDLSPVLRAEAFHVAEHYLRRYSLLIQFTAFLFTINMMSSLALPSSSGAAAAGSAALAAATTTGGAGQTILPKFAQWLKSRPELLNAWKTLSDDGGGRLGDSKAALLSAS